jgi:hypothetical protein
VSVGDQVIREESIVNVRWPGAPNAPTGAPTPTAPPATPTTPLPPPLPAEVGGGGG